MVIYSFWEILFIFIESMLLGVILGMHIGFLIHRPRTFNHTRIPVQPPHPFIAQEHRDAE